jgi:GTP-binding protein EngB required for normal cell division
MKIIPTFAVIGHPNEGKSSVVSTLTENDRIMITPTPGETRLAKEFPIKADGKTILSFIDTPGFQHTTKIIKWFTKYQEKNKSAEGVLDAFLEEFSDNRSLRDDIQLLKPIADGAAVIFVVDASHPMRKHDKYEMEILRLTGCPRMALINNKENSLYLEEWKSELNRHYNIIREFNAHHASFSERIKLLEALKAMQQNWESDLSTAIDTLTENWRSRLDEVANDICNMIEKIIPYKESALLDEEKKDEDELKKNLLERYKKNITKIETRCHNSIRKLFRHDIFKAELETGVIFGENDLFASDTWRVLGLSRTQLTTTASIAGAAGGAAIDLALPGLTFGIFSAGGALIGGLSAFFGAKPISNMRVGIKGWSKKLGGQRLQLGPLKKDSQLIYIIIDRALLYFDTISQWSHARRKKEPHIISITSQSWLTRNWKKEERAILTRYIKSIQTGNNNLRNEICDILIDKMKQN